MANKYVTEEAKKQIGKSGEARTIEVERGAIRRFAEAIASYDTAIAIDPQYVDALVSKGHALHELGRFTEAIACCDSVLTVNPVCAARRLSVRPVFAR